MERENPEPLIMIVGAAPETADSLDEPLKGQAWRVVRVPRIDQTLIAAQRERPDLIVLDGAVANAEVADERLAPVACAASLAACAASLDAPPRSMRR